VQSAQQSLVNLGLAVRAEDFADVDTGEIARRIQFLGLPADAVSSLDAASTTSNLFPIRSPLDGVVIDRHIVAGEVVAASKPSLALAAYAGRYRDAWYGEATIEVEGDHLLMRFSRSPSLTGTLEHWHYDTFVARWRDRSVPDAFVSFALRPDGAIDQFKMEAFSPAADFSYDYQDLLFTPLRGK
jgi:hypothetical protein